MLRPIAVTCGEPSGIGPEIISKAWQQLRDEVTFFMLGASHHLPSNIPSIEIQHPCEAQAVISKGIPVLPVAFKGVLTPGDPNPEHATSVVEAISKGVELVQTGDAAALCTAPIHKQALQDSADFSFPGHTEYLASLANVDRAIMMLASDQLRVVPATIHIPLCDVKAALTSKLLEETLRITAQSLKQQFQIKAPRIAVAGLNPHAGEGGKMGIEEIEIITPTIERLKAEGLNVSGPWSADTMFHKAARETYDAAVCMYHDQALIPIKTLDFDRGVNITLGLPFIRTSPDHGTALDIAGKDMANPTSMIEALKLAASMSQAQGH
ncbi:MAG: 4-hydroxythreonine-4-phosphate dehydrogenase PdxA [Pseudomonadota bacterium]